MSDTVIQVRNLSKRYRIGVKEKSDTFAEQLKNTLTYPIKNFRRITSLNRFKGEDDPSIFWALKDINFDVKQGEVLGIIGKNGAGKSTLLKVLSRITEPTTGEVRIKGRVSSLLEVGTGFHPELTGRDNVYMNGTIHGMSKKEIDRKFDEIVDFSGVEQHIDTPVKFYSSGMKVRLGFAVAAHLEPEILIIDEVLAVGDAEFQKKCLGKMNDVSKSGRTVLFVSHNMTSISNLTNNSLVLNKGKKVFIGKTSNAIRHYLELNKPTDNIFKAKVHPQKPHIREVIVHTSQPNNIHIWGKSLQIEIKLYTPIPLKGTSLSFQILNHHEQPIAHFWIFDSEVPFCRTQGYHLAKCIIPKSRIYMGIFHIKVFFTGPPNGEKYEILENICPFHIKMYNQYREFTFKPDSCTFIDDFSWEIKKIQYENT